MRKRIFLHGNLRAICPDGLEFEANTAAEAIEALCRMVKGFKPKPGQGRHQIRVLGFNTEESLITPTEVQDLHLVPEFYCGKSGGVVNIIVGVVLIIVGTILTYASLGTLSPLGWPMIYMGIAMIAGGIVQMLSPSPKMDTGNFNSDMNPEASKYLGAPNNTVKIGTRIPFGYGRHRVYGHFLSFNIDTKNVAGIEAGYVEPPVVIPDTPPPSMGVEDTSSGDLGFGADGGGASHGGGAGDGAGGWGGDTGGGGWGGDGGWF